MGSTGKGMTLVVLTLLAPACRGAFTPDPSLETGQYAHASWNFRNGFLNGAVYAIAQANDGYLWLGTQSGVFRFDGVRATPLLLPPGRELPSTAVGALLSARDGSLWMGTFDGLASWKDGRLTEYPELVHQTVIALVESRDGTIWAGGFGSPTGKLCAIRSGNTQCYGEDGSLGPAVTSLFEDKQGSLWVGAASGLWRWNPGTPTRILAKPIPNSQAFTHSDQGADAMVAVDSLYQLAGGKLADYPLHGAPSPLTARTLLRDRHGGLWIGTQAHGIVHSFEGKTFVFTQADGLTSDMVVALFEDREGTIWVATPNGLDQFRESPIGSLSVDAGLSSTTTTSILAAHDGSIWIGTPDGLNRWFGGRMRIYRTRTDPGLPDDSIQSLFEDERGRIWVSGFRGLAVFENGRFTAVRSVPAGIVHAIASDNHGGLWLSMWLGTEDYGLVHLVDGAIKEQVPWRRLGGGPGTGLASEPDGGVWTGLLSGGIAFFHAGEVRNVPLTDASGRSRRMLEFGRGSDGALWAATENGLSRIANGRVATLTTANGLPCNAVHWIQDDGPSYWLYTRCGLVRIARTDIDAWIADPRRTIGATTFDTADGIRPVAALKGFRPAVTKSPGGKIWFLNGDTVSVIDPTRIGINRLPPPVHIERIAADDKSYDLKPGGRLPANVRNLRIDYTALSLVAPEKVHFRYKLEGQNRNWHEVINERQAAYTNLPPRNYRFRVMASNNSGVWNETGDTLEFSIAPAYYQTNWFRALLAAIFLALTWAAYQFRVRLLQHESRHLRDVINTIPAYAWSAGQDGAIDFINERWLEFSGFTEEEAVGWGWEAAIHPEDRDRFLAAWRAAVASGKPMEAEARVRRTDGQYRWLLIRNVPSRDKHGKVVKWYGTSTDIEDLKRAEEQRERLRQLEAELAHINRVSMMGELAASIAHEVNQPLSGIVSNAGACLRWLAGDNPDVEEVREAVRDIARDGKRAGDVIARIRSLTKRTALPREKLDLNETIREVLAIVGDDAKGKGVVVRAQFADDLSPVSGDRVQLQQVLLNLTINAMDAMSSVNDRPRELTITTGAIEPDEVQVTVKDSGTGLDPSMMSRVFEPFYTTKSGGMGMGLSICRSILQKHGGRLWAANNDGPGTSFHFILPKYQGAEQNA
jgi:PAS domain S-box-containing protein